MSNATKAKQLFLDDEKNKRTLKIMERLLDGETCYSIGKTSDISKQAVQKTKDKYIIVNQ